MGSISIVLFTNIPLYIILYMSRSICRPSDSRTSEGETTMFDCSVHNTVKPQQLLGADRFMRMCKYTYLWLSNVYIIGTKNERR